MLTVTLLYEIMNHFSYDSIEIVGEHKANVCLWLALSDIKWVLKGISDSIYNSKNILNREHVRQILTHEKTEL